MFNEKLTQIAGFLMEHNPFFGAGFAHAWQDEETGCIWAETPAGRRPVFPDDKQLNYFYLRTTYAARFSASNLFPVIGCQPTGTLATGTMRLVAVVQDADPDKLVSRLANVLAFADAEAVMITGANWQRELVLIEELKYAEEADQQAALQRLKPTDTIVAVDFSLVAMVPFKKMNCLPDICKSC